MNHESTVSAVVRSTFVALAALLSASCAMETPTESDGAIQDPLYIDSNLIFMPTGDSNQTNLRLCWQHNSQAYPTERGWVQDSVTQTWDAHSWVNFEWRFAWAPGGCGGAGAIPLSNKNEWPTGSRNGITFNFINPALYNGSRGCNGAESCIRGVGVHEVGHALGFDHEQAHTTLNCSDGRTVAADNGLFTVDGDVRQGPVDPDSVMSGCLTGSWQLSAGDINAVQATYGGDSRHIEHWMQVFVRQDDGRFWQLNNGALVLSDSAHYLNSSIKVTRVSSTGIVKYGDKVRLSQGLLYMCGQTGTSQRPAAVVWRQSNYASGECDWEVKRSATNVGGSNLDVNDPFKLYLKITATAPGETTFEHTTPRLRMLQKL